jgi:hypothetical protein
MTAKRKIDVDLDASDDDQDQDQVSSPGTVDNDNDIQNPKRHKSSHQPHLHGRDRGRFKLPASSTSDEDEPHDKGRRSRATNEDTDFDKNKDIEMKVVFANPRVLASVTEVIHSLNGAKSSSSGGGGGREENGSTNSTNLYVTVVGASSFRTGEDGDDNDEVEPQDFKGIHLDIFAPTYTVWAMVRASDVFVKKRLDNTDGNTSLYRFATYENKFSLSIGTIMDQGTEPLEMSSIFKVPGIHLSRYMNPAAPFVAQRSTFPVVDSTRDPAEEERLDQIRNEEFYYQFDHEIQPLVSFLKNAGKLGVEKIKLQILEPARQFSNRNGFEKPFPEEGQFFVILSCASVANDERKRVFHVVRSKNQDLTPDALILLTETKLNSIKGGFMLTAQRNYGLKPLSAILSKLPPRGKVDLGIDCTNTPGSIKILYKPDPEDNYQFVAGIIANHISLEDEEAGEFKVTSVTRSFLL